MNKCTECDGKGYVELLTSREKCKACGGSGGGGAGDVTFIDFAKMYREAVLKADEITFSLPKYTSGFPDPFSP